MLSDPVVAFLLGAMAAVLLILAWMAYRDRR